MSNPSHASTRTSPGAASSPAPDPTDTSAESQECALGDPAGPPDTAGHLDTEGLVCAGGGLWVPSRTPGTRCVTRTLADLLDPDLGAYLVDEEGLRSEADRDDAVLYHAHRHARPARTLPRRSRRQHALPCRVESGDLAPAAGGRRAPAWAAAVSEQETTWSLDVVTYRGGTLPAGREASRSLGHWHGAAQRELFQCLRGQVVVITATPIGDRLRVLQQRCGPGDVALVPPGAFHLTVVSGDAPAVVANIYTELPEHTRPGDTAQAVLEGVQRAPGSEAVSAGHPNSRGTWRGTARAAGEAKYRGRRPPRISAVLGSFGLIVVGEDAPGGEPRTITSGWGLGMLLPPAGLAALHAAGTDHDYGVLVDALDVASREELQR